MDNSTMNLTSGAFTDSVYDLVWGVTPLDLCMHSISFLFGVPTHLYVLWLIVTGSSGISLEFFILNLFICEIGICLHSLLAVIVYFAKISSILSSFSLGLLVTGRGLFQCLMCVERYLAVVHPVTFLKYKPLRYRVICCAAAWMIILGSCFCCTVAVDQFKYHIYIYFYSSQYLLFFFIQLFCLVAVLRVLKQSGPGERKREKEENNMKRKAFHLILITTVTMSIIYIPFIVCGFLFIFTKIFILDFFSFGYLCFILAGFVQPVLYLRRSGKLSTFCPSKTFACLI